MMKMIADPRQADSECQIDQSELHEWPKDLERPVAHPNEGDAVAPGREVCQPGLEVDHQEAGAVEAQRRVS